MNSPRIAIIGAGPAGCASAFHLASCGFPVTIFESRPFPRTKVCGEFISPAATHLLESILPPAVLRRAGARQVDRFVLQLCNRERTLPMRSPAWALSRDSLDTLLLAAAQDAGASVLQPAPVARVDHQTAAPCRIHLASGDIHDTDLILHADGHGRFCPTRPTPNRRGLLAIKCHFAPHRPVAGVAIRSAPGGYVGTMQIEPSEAHPSHATLALVARKSLLSRHDNDIDALVQSLWPAWSPASRTTPWLTCGVPHSGFQPSGHPRAFRLGNAAAAVDPVGGEGIGLGLWSGMTLASLLIDAMRPGRANAPDLPKTLTRAHRRYATLYHRRLLLRRPACALAASALTHPRLIASIWPLLALDRLTLLPWYLATGKPIRAPDRA